MINFRYHVVSLTAVFLALVIGVAMGSTVISKATVDGLRHNLNTVEKRIDSTQADNTDLRSRLSAYQRQNDELSEQMLQPLVSGRLADDPVLLIASQGIDAASLNLARTALTDAGANFDGTLLVDDRLALSGGNTAKLAQLLDVSPSADVLSILVDRLAAVLRNAAAPVSVVEPTTTTEPKSRVTTTTRPATSGADGTIGSGGSEATPAPTSTSTTTTTVPSATSVSEPELVTELRQAGFLDFRPRDGGSANDLVLTTHNYRFVVISGPSPDVPNEQFLYPLLRAMAASGATSVVAASAATGNDAESNRTAFVGPIRQDRSMNGRISTVDDLERFPGLAAMVFAVQEVDHRHGNYGFGSGAQSLLPDPSP